MKLDLSEPMADELRSTLESVLGEMSSEIADTDNAAYRRELVSRRERLAAIQTQLGAS